MSFLLRVAGAARAVPDLPVARPKGLIPGLPAAAPPIEPPTPAAAPLYPTRPAPSSVSTAPPERMARPRPVNPPPTPLDQPAAETSAPKVPGDDTSVVVEQRVPPPAAAEASSPEPARAAPPDAGRPASSAPAVDAGPAFDAHDLQPPSLSILDVALRRDAPQTRPPPGPRLEGPVELSEVATRAPDDATTTPGAPIDRRDLALRVEPPQRDEGALASEPEAPAPAARPLEQADRRAHEVLPIAQPLTSIPPPRPPAERALPARPAAEPKPPMLQIDQIDVVVADPAPAPVARARPFAAVAANRRYLRRL